MKIIEIEVVTNCVRNNFCKKSASYSGGKTFVKKSEFVFRNYKTFLLSLEGS